MRELCPVIFDVLSCGAARLEELKLDYCWLSDARDLDPGSTLGVQYSVGISTYRGHGFEPLPEFEPQVCISVPTFSPILRSQFRPLPGVPGLPFDYEQAQVL